MAKSTEAVWEFENDLLEKIQPKANWDTNELLQLKYDTIEGNDRTITDWQKDYYENQLLLKKHRVDSEEVKQYFQVDNVI